MNVQVNKQAQSTVELTIEITPEELKSFEARAVARLAGSLSLPGFRPGKVPEALARKNIDPIKVLEETANIAIPELYSQAVIENKIESIGSPKIDVQKFAPGNPLVFKATVAVLPEFTLPDYKALNIEKKPVSVSDDQIDRMLRMFQRERAKEQEVTRPAKKGDSIEIDFAMTQKKVPLEHGQGTKHPLVLGDGNFIPGFEDQLIGMSAGQEKDFSVTFPKDYGKKSLAGQTADAHVKLHLVKERSLPELDDAFATGLGNFKDLADLKSQLRKNLMLEAEVKENDRFESELLTRLADQVSLELPDVLLQGELDKMARELEQSLTAQGANFRDYLSSINKTMDDLKKGWVEQAKKRVKIGLLIRVIAKKENVAVSDQEAETEINATLKQNPDNKEVERTVKGRAYREYVKEIVRNRKTIKLLSSIAAGSTNKP
ncbi:MAG: trigger factor, partial [bacterium]|nr:trigger factor [bacterium]